MTTKIFVNLPVTDLKKSMSFYSKLGFANNPQFTDDTAACMVLSDSIYVMLLTYNKFKDFTKKEIADAKKTTQVLLTIDAESREKVDELIATAKTSGGNIYMEPSDYGWMYQHGFADLDGHQWELVYMDETKIPKSS
jgi:hypothetical protein